MQRLGPICLEPAVPQAVTYSGGPYDFDARTLPDLQVSLRRDPEGGFVLLAASVADRPVAADFTLAGLGPLGAVTEVFDGRPVPVRDDGFADRIEPLGVRAYRIAAPARAAEPVALTVAMTPGPEAGRPAAYGKTGRTGMKNLLPNPSLEDASVPGRPDYWRQTGADLKPWERMGGSNQVWGLSSESPYHGERCLVMTASNGAARIVYWAQEFPHRARESYVFSVWLRADRDGVPAFLHAGPESRAVTVTREWRRYHLPFAAAAQRRSFMVRFHGAPGGPAAPASLWCDAFQVEKGDVPTAFEP